MKKEIICFTIVLCVLTMISLFVMVGYKKILRTQTRISATREIDQLQKELLLEIKNLGANVHTEFSYYQNEEKYLHVLISEPDYLKLREILRLISLLPQLPSEIIVRQAYIDDDIVIFLQKIDPKRLRFWDCSFDENLVTPYRENSKLEWLTMNQCKFSSRFFDLLKESQISMIYLIHTEIGLSEMKCINQLKSLYSLVINYSHLEEDALPILTNISTLEEIDLSNTKVSKKMISVLSHLRHIKKISLNECNLTEIDLSWLSSYNNGACLEIFQTVISDSQAKLLNDLKIHKKISILGEPVIVPDVGVQGGALVQPILSGLKTPDSEPDLGVNSEK